MKKYFILEKEYYNIESSVITEIINNNFYNRELVFSNNNWSDYLKIFLVLTHKPEIIESKKFDAFSLLINRYFWLKKFYYHYSLTQGKDDGIEQQIFQLIEEISNHDENFDWLIIQQIDSDIENH